MASSISPKATPRCSILIRRKRGPPKPEPQKFKPSEFKLEWRTRTPTKSPFRWTGVISHLKKQIVEHPEDLKFCEAKFTEIQAIREGLKEAR